MVRKTTTFLNAQSNVKALFNTTLLKTVCVHTVRANSRKFHAKIIKMLHIGLTCKRNPYRSLKRLSHKFRSALKFRDIGSWIFKMFNNNPLIFNGPLKL
jgi:hypothetical protein